MSRPSKPWFWEARKCWATNLNGRRYTAPRTVVSEHEAWVWHKSVVDGAAPVTVGSMQVHQLAERYLAWDVKRIGAGQRSEPAHNTSACKLTRVCATEIDGVKIGEMPVALIRSGHLKKAILEWQGEKKANGKRLSTNYVHDLGTVFRAMLNWAVHEGWVAVYPFTKTPLPRAPKAASRFATRLEAAMWLRFLWRSGRKDFAFLQRCLIHSGARPSELTQATWDEVNWSGWTDKAGHAGAIIARTDWKNAKKNGETRRVYLPASLCRSLRRRLEGPTDRSNHVFTTIRGSAWTGTNMSTTVRRLRKVAIAQGLPFQDTDDGADCLTNYRWRHTAASSLLMRGVPPAIVGKLLGTSAEMIVSTYGHVIDGALADAASLL